MPLHLRLAPLLLLLTTLFLSSCQVEDPVPEFTKAWLTQAQGDQLTFRNPATGATVTLTAQVQDLSRYSGGKFNPVRTEHEFISLFYAFPNPLRSVPFHIQFNGDADMELGDESPQFSRYGYVETHKRASKEKAYGSDQAVLELLDNVQLHDRTYERVVHLRYLGTGYNGLTEYWYSKHDGLVAFNEVDANGNPQAWYRVW